LGTLLRRLCYYETPVESLVGKNVVDGGPWVAPGAGEGGALVVSLSGKVGGVEVVDRSGGPAEQLLQHSGQTSATVGETFWKKIIQLKKKRLLFFYSSF